MDLDEREELLDTLALLAGAFSRVVRERGGDPTRTAAYERALRVLGRDLERAHRAAHDLVCEDAIARDERGGSQ